MEKKKYTLTNDGKAKISINVPVKMMEKVDTKSKQEGLTRSSWITLAILEKISRDKE